MQGIQKTRNITLTCLELCQIKNAAWDATIGVGIDPKTPPDHDVLFKLLKREPTSEERREFKMAWNQYTKCMQLP